MCNDSLVKKLEELERTEEMYSGLVDHSRRVLMGYFDLVRVSKVILASYSHLISHYYTDYLT